MSSRAEGGPARGLELITVRCPASPVAGLVLVFALVLVDKRDELGEELAGAETSGEEGT